MPLGPKLIVALTLAYAISPIDLIPDFIPILGMLDDLILVPLGLALAIRLIPAPVWADLQARADSSTHTSRTLRLIGFVLIVTAWAGIAALIWILWHRG